MRRKILSAGSFNELVTLQVLTDSHLNEFGEQSPSASWEDLVDLWVKVELVKASEQWQEGTDQIDATYKLSLWWEPTASEMTAQSHRVLWGGRILRVITVEDVDNEHVFLEVVCIARLGAVS